MIILYIIIAILVLLLMVTIHELGHYLVGKKLGFKIDEFAIGFGKAIWQKKNKSGELISIRIFPLGGYCAFYGEEGASDKEKKEKDPDIFTNQPVWKRILVFLAGVAFNIVSAFIFSFLLLVTVGYGNVYNINNVNENFLKYYNVGEGLYQIEKGDKILAINEKEISWVWDQKIENMVEREVGNTYTLTIKKAETGEIVNVELVMNNDISTTYDKESKQFINQLDDQGHPVYITGFGLDISLGSMPLSFFDALLECFSFTIGLIWLTLESLWMLITFQLPISDLGGPITVVSTMADMASQSLAIILVFLPLLAVNLGIFNALPFPALDGSHVLFAIIEWIRGKPVNQNVENWIHTIGMMVLLGFVLVIDFIHLIL